MPGDRERRRTAPARAFEAASGHLFEHAPDLLGAADAEGYFTALSPAWERTLGFSRKALMSQPFIEFVHPDDRAETMRESAKLNRDGEASARFRNRYACASGGWRWLDWRTAVSEGEYFFVARDVTEQVASEERELVLSALVDASDDPVYTVGLDGMVTTWNCACERLYGYAAEEAAGRPVAELIFPDERAVEPDVITRRLLSGGQVRRFSTDHVTRDGQRLRVTLTASLLRDEEGAPMGIGVIARDVSASQATSREDLASLVQLQRLREALAEDRIEFFAQPLVSFRGGERSLELLCRMRDRDGGIVPPQEFLPAAERFGQIEWIDRLAIRRAAQLVSQGHRVNVNLSGLTIAQQHFAGVIAGELHSRLADPSGLVIEITETALLEDMEAGERFAQQAARLGCQISLDDFGAGYGGFTYLKRLAFDQLKIDREFVKDLTTSHASQNVVKAVVSLAQAFGLEVVAEGVEDEDTFVLLDHYGVDRAQGYLFGRPCPIGELIDEAPGRD